MRQNTVQFEDRSKAVLRRKLRARRSRLSNSLRATHDAAIGQHLLQLVKSRKIGTIACYWPFDGEPDITPVYHQLLADAYELALPVISGKNDHLMFFHSWRMDTELVKNRYGICEPHETSSITLSNVDMLFLPLVAYDRFGSRLGMGSGYYDRCLEPFRDLVTPMRVGIAYGLQEIELIDRNKWDVPLHAVVNENGWFTFTDHDLLTTFSED